ncbi:hypothetical protein V6N11_019928 [Hibiscus sabdariffa]|uniref:Secreted protein n=1 Tax=Hibiscus sabdariffa TaxID=183260 RepID=A0ABR1ZK28_9ROSI
MIENILIFRFAVPSSTVSFFKYTAIGLCMNLTLAIFCSPSAAAAVRPAANRISVGNQLTMTTVVELLLHYKALSPFFLFLTRPLGPT